PKLFENSFFASVERTFPAQQGAHFRPYLIEWIRFSIPPPCMQGGYPRPFTDKQLQAGSSEETPEEAPDPALVFSVSQCLSGESSSTAPATDSRRRATRGRSTGRQP